VIRSGLLRSQAASRVSVPVSREIPTSAINRDDLDQP